MTEFRLKLYIEGLEPNEKYFREIGERAWEGKPVLLSIRKLMEAAAQIQFESQGGRSGEPWKPIKQDTIERKLDEGYPRGIEVRTDSLRESLMGGKDSVKKLSKSATAFGTRVFYAQFQGHERRLLAITQADANVYASKMVDWILNGRT